MQIFTFFSKILAYMPYLMISFNDTLTNDIVSFGQLGPVGKNASPTVLSMSDQTRSEHHENMPI